MLNRLLDFNSNLTTDHGSICWTITIFNFNVGNFFLLYNITATKKTKKGKKFLSNLKKGDRVIAKSGIHGKIAEVNYKDDTCVLETLAGKIKMERSAISIDLSGKINDVSKK